MHLEVFIMYMVFLFFEQKVKEDVILRVDIKH